MRDDDFIHVLESFLGIVEDPPGSNQTPIGREFGLNGVAWCAETVSVACKRLGFPLHEASVARIEAHAKAGDWGMSWSRIPVRCAAVCFDWGGRGNWNDMHVGVVTDVLDGGRFRTIEGNYHDSCQRVLRDMKFVRGFANFPFEGSTSPVVSAPASPPVPATMVTHHILEGHPVSRQLINVPLDDQGDGYTSTDIPYDSVLAVSSHAPLFPPRDKRYGKLAKAGHHNEGGKLVVFVEGGEPKQTAIALVAVAD